MNDFIFVSPSVKFKEKDLTLATSSFGITTASLVGETPKGPAFQPVYINSKSRFRTIFGNQSSEKIGSNYKYLLNYYANSYLQQSNQLYVTRVLGLSGYDVGTGWGIKIEANVDPSTTGDSTSTTGSASYTGGTFSGQTVVQQTGTTFTINPTFTKNLSTNSFNGTRIDYTVDSFTGTSGNVSFTSTTVTGTSYSQYEDMVVGIVRTRGAYSTTALTYNASAMTLTLSGDTNDPYSNFILSTSGTTEESYNVSLNPDATNFAPRVVGNAPKDKNTSVYVEAIYPDLIRKLRSDGLIYGVNTTLVKIDSDDCNTKTDFKIRYQTPKTPWIVSQLRGTDVDRLFKFVLMSDGNSANSEIKISFANIKPESNEFDVIIRDFNDTDANPIILESYTRCSLAKNSNNFIGKRIGDNGINFNNTSEYVYLEFADYENLPQSSFPAGFEGYNLRNFSVANTCGEVGATPSLFYKKSYSTSDKIGRVYLGVSERAYDYGSTVGKGINQNLFNYYGNLTGTGLTKTKGFHLDSGATDSYTDGTYSIGEFEVGAGKLQVLQDVLPATSPYNSLSSRKFTVVPYGGFDGWDIYRDERTTKDVYSSGGIYEFDNSDYDAYLSAINLNSNATEVEANLFVTAGINFSDQESLVSEAIDMVETRGDMLYIIDSPDLGNISTYSQDITDLLSTTSIDTSWGATYGPHIQYFDTDSTVNVWIPPTGEVIRTMALTDSVRFPWFAPAGQTRGVLNAKNTRVKLSTQDRDTLYANRINPIQFYPSIISIMGQKTLQIQDTALDRINVRRLLIYMRKLIANVANTLLFEQNDNETVREFLNKVNPILTNIERERGISAYEISYQDINTPESLDRNELYFNIAIKPIAALEFIGITFIVTPTGVSFENI